MLSKPSSEISAGSRWSWQVNVQMVRRRMQLFLDLLQIDNPHFTPEPSSLEWWDSTQESRLLMRPARYITALLALVCVAAAGVSHAAGRMFSDGFESGNTNQWSADG